MNFYSMNIYNFEHNTAWILHRLSGKVIGGNSGFFV